MSDEKTPDKVVVVGSDPVQEKIIKQVVKKSLTAEGDLTVEKTESRQVDLGGTETKIEEESEEPKETPLPEIGDKFMLNCHEYKVVYINTGQKRFSCIPCKGVY